MNFDLFTTAIAVWTGTLVLSGLFSVLLADLDRLTRMPRVLPPKGDESAKYQKAA